MPTYNRVLLMGNLTRDPERKEAGEAVICKFALAVNRKYRRRDSEEWLDEVSFFDIECWGKLAGVCLKYLGKGSPVFIEGALKQNRWETDDNKKRSRVIVVAQTVQFIGERESASGQDAAGEEDQRPPGEGGTPASRGEDDVPF